MAAVAAVSLVLMTQVNLSRCNGHDQGDLQWLHSSLRFNPYKVEWAEVVLALQLHQNPNAIIPPAGGGGGSAGTFVSMQKLGDLEQQFTEYSNAGNATSGDCSDCANPEVINKFPFLVDLLGCWLNQERSLQAGA